MPTRFFITLALIILGEIYSFILVRSAVKNLPGVWRISLFVLYLLVTALAWSSIFFFRRIDWASLPHMARNIFVAFTLGFFIAKLLVAVIMLTDDIRRIIVWIFYKIAPAKTVAATTGKGITRSVFMKRLALILAGTTIGGFLYGITNRYNYKLREIKLSFKKLPAGQGESFRGYHRVQNSWSCCWLTDTSIFAQI